MSFTNSDVIPASATGYYDYTIDQSLRFNDDDYAHLLRTFSSGNRKTWTWSAWFKRSNLTDYARFFAVVSGNSGIQIQDDHRIRMYNASPAVSVVTDAVFRDTSAWYHLVVVLDTTQGSSSNRVKIYINGDLQTVSGTYPSYDANLGLNSNVETRICSYNGASNTGAEYFDGYLAEVNFIDGQALDPTYFGETGDYGDWKPIEYTGSYGTNGFYLDFDGTYYNDKSGNGNNWTANNLATTDVVPDSPTNNFCTLNLLDTNATLSEGNLWAKDLGTYTDVPATFGMSSGKWYAEFYNKDSSTSLCGITRLSNNGMNHSEVDSLRTIYEDNGYIYRSGTGLSDTNTGTTHGTGDIIGITLDVDAGTIAFYKNGTLVNSTTNSVYSSNDWKFYVGVADNCDWICNFGQDSSFAGNKTAQGNTDSNNIGDFYYTPPSGYLALCTANLPDPAVIPSENFNTVLYTGNSSTNNITGVGFQPDFTWIKNRNSAQSHCVIDVVRGATKFLQPNETASEGTISDFSFATDGFNLTSSNALRNSSGNNYVAWNWKLNGSGSSNTNGTITTTVSAVPDAGMSIFTFTGNGSSGATVGHGLTKAPEFVIIKPRTVADNWNGFSYYQDGGTGTNAADYTFYWNLTNAPADSPTFWNDTYPTSSVITLGNNNGQNGSGEAFLGWAFHSVDGFCKAGVYTGNGSTNGTFVYTGFKPEFVMIKDTSNARANPVMDSVRSYNGNTKSSFFHSDQTEQTHLVDYLSNGFKFRTSDDNFNASGVMFVYLAFAENPFKYTTAR